MAARRSPRTLDLSEVAWHPGLAPLPVGDQLSVDSEPSLGGVRFPVEGEPPEIGDSLRVTFTAGRRTITATGRVVWMTEVEPGQTEVGLEFYEPLGTRDEAALARGLEERHSDKKRMKNQESPPPSSARSSLRDPHEAVAAPPVRRRRRGNSVRTSIGIESETHSRAVANAEGLGITLAAYIDEAIREKNERVASDPRLQEEIEKRRQLKELHEELHPGKKPRRRQERSPAK